MALFRSENRSRKKTNLMVFLRPVVVRDSMTSDALMTDRYEAIRALQQVVQPDNNLVMRSVSGAAHPATAGAPRNASSGRACTAARPCSRASTAARAHAATNGCACGPCGTSTCRGDICRPQRKRNQLNPPHRQRLPRHCRPLIS